MAYTQESDLKEALTSCDCKDKLKAYNTSNQ